MHRYVTKFMTQSKPPHRLNRTPTQCLMILEDQTQWSVLVLGLYPVGARKYAYSICHTLCFTSSLFKWLFI